MSEMEENEIFLVLVERFSPRAHGLPLHALSRIGHRTRKRIATTTTPTKTSLQNITLFHLCYFNICSSYSTFTETANYPGTKLVRVAIKLRKKMKHSPSCVHVLHETLNLVISRCCFVGEGKEMYQNVKRTCKAIVFAH